MTALINPRTDLPRVAEQMYRALKSAGSCSCAWAWSKAGYGPVTECSKCAALAAYEALTEVSK